MAKKKKTIKKKQPATQEPTPEPLSLTDTAELAPDDSNPRQITDRAAGGLRNSIKRFGDLSGIVFNRRTGDLVCGHQRMQQIRAEYGDQPIEVLDADSELGCIRIDAAHVFSIRVVEWSKAKQRAANVAANNQGIAGQFTDDLTIYLLEVEADLTEEAPGLLDEVLLTELIAGGIDLPEDEDVGGQGVAGAYEVVVSCNDEEDQRKVYEELKAKGLSVKVLTL